MARPNNSLPPPRHPAIWWSRVKLRWPLLLWLAAAAAALWLYRQGGSGAVIRGVVETVYEEAAPLETARLGGCFVEVGQRVEAGEILVRFDTGLIDAEIATRRLEIERQFLSNRARLSADLRDAVRRHSRESAELEALGEELERMEDLVRRRLLDTQDVVRFRTRHRVLVETVKEHRAEIAELEAELEETRKRQEATAAGWTGVGEAILEDLPPGTGDAVPGWLTLRRDGYILRAERAGVVARIHARPGDVVQAGSPVVTLVSDLPPRIIGFLPEGYPRPPAPGRTLHITRPGGGTTVRGEVRAVNPEMRGLAVASRLGLGAGRTARGREIIVDPVQENDLLPGESVHLHPQRPWWRAWRSRRGEDG